jgi:hypothetical protein
MISSGRSESWIKLARFSRMTTIIYQSHSRNPEEVVVLSPSISIKSHVPNPTAYSGELQILEQTFEDV